MTIIIRTINHEEQRYPTIGDWRWYPNNVLEILISNLNNEKMNSLVAIHELIEALLCRFNNPEITTEMVDEFDKSHPELEEPGESIEAPYHTQHIRSTIIEELLATWLELDWKEWEEYEKKIKSL